MKAKLIKNELPSGYFLYNEKGDLIASTIKGYRKQPLSLKNCQAIERGYDLDELAENKWNELSKQLGLSIQDKAMWCGGFKHGLLELLGDKKFSEDELKLAFFHVQNEPTFDVFKESLQQTEWEVEVEMEYINIGAVSSYCHPKDFETEIPKLDADGCLVLKRI